MVINTRNKFTRLSFLLSLMVLLRHSLGIGIYDLPKWLFHIELYLRHLTDIAVPVFFCISGFLFYQNLNANNLQRKLKDRLHSIVIPFLAWSFIGYLFYLSVTSIFGNKMNMVVSIPHFSLPGTLIDIFVLTKYNITWFLAYLICYVYITPLFLTVCKKIYAGLLFLALALTAGLYFNLDLLTYSSPYIAGALWGLHHKEKVLRRFNPTLQLFSLIFILITVEVETFLDLPEGPLIIPLRLIQICFLWIAADHLATATPQKWWMQLSFFIYCSHHWILESIEKCILFVTGNNTFGAIIDILTAPLITLSILFALALVLKRNKHLWKVLTGGRG